MTIILPRRRAPSVRPNRPEPAAESPLEGVAESNWNHWPNPHWKGRPNGLEYAPSRTVLIPVTGDSMVEAGIRPGDRVVVERDVPARPGDLVIAMVDGEFTLKTLAVEDGEAVLKPANPAYPVLRPGQRLAIFGVVVGLIRSYRR